MVMDKQCQSTISTVKNLEHWHPQLTKVEAAFKSEEAVFATPKSKTVLVVGFVLAKYFGLFE